MASNRKRTRAVQVAAGGAAQSVDGGSAAAAAGAGADARSSRGAPALPHPPAAAAAASNQPDVTARACALRKHRCQRVNTTPEAQRDRALLRLQRIATACGNVVGAAAKAAVSAAVASMLNAKIDDDEYDVGSDSEYEPDNDDG